MEFLGIIGVVLLVAIVLGIKTLTNLIYVCGPNEVLVFSGTTRRSGNRQVGYKIIKGGRGIRIPLLETVDLMDLTNMVIDVNVTGAYSAGGIPLNVQAVANVKIAGDEPYIHNALERLLGKTREAVMRIAKETLEGNLRGVLAQLTPEQVNEDKHAFAQSMIEEAEHDLTQLGIVLDTLKIQNVTDDQGYLHAIGRKQNAELQKNARIAEANAKAEAVITGANNEEQIALAQIQAQHQVADAEAQRRIVDAQTMRGAVVAEQRSEVAALVAKAEAELEVQRARIDQVRQQLQAEVVEPAAARRDAMIYDARGAAARTIEDGRARAEALEHLTRVWREQGTNAKQVLVLQKLESVAEILTSSMRPVDVENLTFIDGGAGEIAERGTLPMRAISTVEQIKRTTGIDLGEVARAVGSSDTVQQLSEADFVES